MCPYCGSNLFVGASTVRRDEGELDANTHRINQTWQNECYDCGKWSLYKDSVSGSVALVDPDDPESAEVT